MMFKKLVLDNEERAALNAISTKVFKPAKKVIFTQGDIGRNIYRICSGAVRLEHQLKDGRNQIFAFFWPGDIFGTVEGEVYPSSATTLVNTHLFQIPYSQLRYLIQKYPRIQTLFLQEALKYTKSAEQHLLLATYPLVIKRLAGFLLECCKQKDFFDIRSSILTLPMDRKDIADYLGFAPETTSRTLKELEDMDLIKRLATQRILIHVEKIRRVF
ncbi:Crp/Fnr family transcriptional regulator [Novacetimonas pomaceti]|uniref:Crp/Fnr family transcriptional regulator n=1 Tax=Novacetimonas pomaceti TaxID=2021998 RepID=UPI001EF06DF4|nr:Crp/Fnr family transcriptional regulator [Novacetimonas pomaceti]